MNDFFERTGKILMRIDELAAISDDKLCITRTFGSDAFMAGRKKVFTWMEEAGLQTHIDNIGNVRGKAVSSNSEALTFIVASHIDTVVNAGKFDGPLGVLMGLDIVEGIVRSKKEIPFHIELIAFSDEEGVRFHTTFLGSRVVAGSFENSLLERKDEQGIRLQEVIELMGGDSSLLINDTITKEDCLGYFEMHIEQGPVLYEKNLPAAVVSSIAGQARVEIIFKGMAGHAGTVPMDMRQDALCCAGEFIIETEKFAKATKNIVATIGKLQIMHAASNVIPGEVTCSLDLRSADKNKLVASYEKLQALCTAICRKRNIVVEWKLVQETAPVACDKNMSELLALSVKEAGYEMISLVSGAGHDAVAMSSIAPVCMLFVRCFKGISHNPLEHADEKDIAAALKIADNFIHNLIEKYKR